MQRYEEPFGQDVTRMILIEINDSTLQSTSQRQTRRNLNEQIHLF